RTGRATEQGDLRNDLGIGSPQGVLHPARVGTALRGDETTTTFVSLHRFDDKKTMSIDRTVEPKREGQTDIRRQLMQHRLRKQSSKKANKRRLVGQWPSMRRPVGVKEILRS